MTDNVFKFTAVDEAGATVTGEIDAPDEATVIQILRDRGLFPVRAEQGNSLGFIGFLNQDLFTRDSPGRNDVPEFTREMATMLGSAAELDKSLEIIATLTRSPKMNAIVKVLLADVRGGKSFADSLAKHELSFPGYYVSMVRAGEAGGTLDEVFEQLADYLETMQTTRKRVISALIYPCILVGMSLLSIGVLIVFVLPSLQPLFVGSGNEIPTGINILLSINQLIENYWWLIVAITIAGLIAFNRALAQPRMREAIDRRLLQTPGLGRLIKSIEVARLSRTLGTLLRSGVPMSAALQISQSVAKNNAILRETQLIREEVVQGKGLAETLGTASFVSDRAAHLLRIGEESGRLEDMLDRIATIYDRAVERDIEAGMTILTPTVTIIMGVMVAGIVATMFMAILSLNNFAT